MMKMPPSIAVFFRAGSLILLVSVSGYLGYRGVAEPRKPLEIVRIADGRQLGGAALYAALDQGYFRKQGLDVRISSYAYGKLALEAVLTGRADFATVAETPFVHGVLNGHALRLVTSLARSDEFYGIFLVPGSGIQTPEELRGRKIGMVAGTTSDYFLHLMLNLNGLKRGEVEIISMSPAAILPALRAGEIDAVSVWGNMLQDLKQEFGKEAIVFDGDGIYTFYWNLVTSQTELSRNPERVEKIMRALQEGEKWCHSRPAECKAVTARATQDSFEDVAALWNSHQMQLGVSQALLISCENQARLFREESWIKPPFPNFLHFFALDALRKVTPTGITLIE